MIYRIINNSIMLEGKNIFTNKRCLFRPMKGVTLNIAFEFTYPAF